MKIKILFFFLFSILFSPNIIYAVNTPDSNSKAAQLIQNLPVQFIENKGQMVDMEGKPVPSVLYKAEVAGLNLYITEKGLTYVFIKSEQTKQENTTQNIATGIAKPPIKNENLSWERIEMLLKGAVIKKENILTEGISTDFSQYFLAHCPDGITDVHSFKKITIKEIYPGIDWVFYNSTDKGFKYDFIVHPKADPKQIEMIYSSLSPLVLNELGELEIKGETGTIHEQAPYSFIEETKNPIESHFKITGQQKLKDHFQTHIQFSGIERSMNQTIIIDPQLVWATYYGGVSSPQTMSINCDKFGNLFISGTVGSFPFPFLNPGGGAYFQGTLGGTFGCMNDAFILKFNNNGVLLWSTYYGGNQCDFAYSITTDINGNVIVAGETQGNTLPVQNPGGGSYFQGTSGGNEDIFILKFTNAGVRIWATYYGGTSADRAYAVTTDAAGNIFITGFTVSINFPVLATGGTTYFQPPPPPLQRRCIIIKFTNSGILLWATCYSGNVDELGFSLCIDIYGNLFVTGLTSSPAMPIVNPGGGAYFQTAPSGVFLENFILKFTNSGQLLWATFFGGTGSEGFNGIKTDGLGNIFIVGSTTSLDFPLLDPGGGTYFQGINAGNWDGFITKFSNTGVLIWSTYYGKGGSEFAGDDNSLAIDPCNNVYVTFSTGSEGMPCIPDCNGGFFENTFDYYTGTFTSIIKFNNSGRILWATYFDGDNTWGNCNYLTTDASSNLFISGSVVPASAATFPLTNPGGGSHYDPFLNTSTLDMYIAKFTQPFSITSSSAFACGCMGNAAVSVIGGCAPYQFNWSNSTGTIIDSIQSISGLCAGQYLITVTDSSYNCATDTITLVNTWNASLTGTDSICNGQVSSLVATGGGSYLWNTGATTAALNSSPTSTTPYSVIINNGTECIDTLTQTVVVTPNPVVTVNSPLICFGETAVLTANGGTSYTWIGGASISGANTAVASPSTTSNYTIIGTTLGCSDTATSIITVNPLPIVIVSPDTTIGGGSFATLHATGGSTYSWSPGIGLSCTDCSDPIASPFEATVYCVTITDSVGCSSKACIKISLEDCATNKNLDVPNAFTPDQNGTNDELCLEGWTRCVYDFQIFIFDRWGEKVFESTNPDFCWNGIYKGEYLDPGVYVYYINVKLYNGHKTLSKKGNISLIR